MTEENLKAADGLLADTQNALRRGELLKKNYDYSGAIQAYQQCIELSVKALYRAVGLRPAVVRGSPAGLPPRLMDGLEVFTGSSTKAVWPKANYSSTAKAGFP